MCTKHEGAAMNVTGVASRRSNRQMRDVDRGDIDKVILLHQHVPTDGLQHAYEAQALRLNRAYGRSHIMHF